MVEETWSDSDADESNDRVSGMVVGDHNFLLFFGRHCACKISGRLLPIEGARAVQIPPGCTSGMEICSIFRGQKGQVFWGYSRIVVPHTHTLRAHSAHTVFCLLSSVSVCLVLSCSKLCVGVFCVSVSLMRADISKTRTTAQCTTPRHKKHNNNNTFLCLSMSALPSSETDVFQCVGFFTPPTGDVSWVHITAPRKDNWYDHGDEFGIATVIELSTREPLR